jgi:signal transduction histidine kinase
VRAGSDDAFVRVEVQDTGIGIPKKDVAHLFDEFYRVKSKETRAITGTGLGLSIAKKIVEGHNGHIEVESKLHQGSTFRVLLPI